MPVNYANRYRLHRSLRIAGLCGLFAFSVGAIAQSTDGTRSAADAGAVVAVGPLELVAPTSVTVLGRDYDVADTYGLSVGDKVAVHGTLQLDGTLSSAWVEQLGPYVAGSDLVYETGIVASVNETFGTMTVNGSTVDYTATLAAADSAVPVAGQLVSVVGSQPAVGGTIFVSTAQTGIAAVRIAYSAHGLMSSLSTTGGNLRSASTTGGNLRSYSTTGGNLGSLSTTGGNVGSLSTTGGNLGSLSTTGGNVGSLSTTGGNLGSLSTTGGNVGSLSTTGGNLGSLSTTGGNVGSLSTTGGNLGSLSTTGGNVGSLSTTGGNLGSLSTTGGNVGSLSTTGGNLGSD
jgi:hypothetical protein